MLKYFTLAFLVLGSVTASADCWDLLGGENGDYDFWECVTNNKGAVDANTNLIPPGCEILEDGSWYCEGSGR